MGAVCLCTFSANAQRVSAHPAKEQLARVNNALERLAPFQIAGCWLNPRVLPLIGLAASEDKGVQAASIVEGVGTPIPLTLVQAGDVLVSVDGAAIKQEDSIGRDFGGKARASAIEKLSRSGRTFVEIYKNAQGQLVSVMNPVKLDCQASDMYISDENSDRAAHRGFLGLNISSSRLALLNDEQLLAFLAWNHAFVAMRNETNANFWGFIASSNARTVNFVYSSSAQEKIDWITFTALGAMNANLNAYGTMLTVADAFDKAAGLPFWSDKRFIAADSGGSPFGGEEKQARLVAWVKLLEQDAQAPAPANLKFSNALLASPTWSARTLPLAKYQTVGEALQPLLGEAQAKAVAEEYMSNFDGTKPPDIVQYSARPKDPSFQMLYVHHATNRLIWLDRLGPAEGDGEVCVRPADCSLIAVGPHVVARPSPIWAKELKANAGATILEKISTKR